MRNQSCIKAWEVNVAKATKKALPFSALREDQRDAARRAPAQERTAEEAVQDDLEQMRQKLEDKTHGS